MYALELAHRTNDDLSEALAVSRPMTPPAAPGAPPQGPLAGSQSQPSPAAPAGPPAAGAAPPIPGRPQSMAMANLTMRPPTQNPIMGGLTQVKGFAKGGLVRSPPPSNQWACR